MRLSIKVTPMGEYPHGSLSYLNGPLLSGALGVVSGGAGLWLQLAAYPLKLLHKLSDLRMDLLFQRKVLWIERTHPWQDIL